MVNFANDHNSDYATTPAPTRSLDLKAEMYDMADFKSERAVLEYVGNPIITATKGRTIRDDKMKKTQPAAAPKAAPKPVKAEIITLRNIAAELAEAHNLSQKQANEVLADAIDLIGKHLKKGARIRIAGLGTLAVRERAARMGRNPSTGAPIKIEASKKVAFRPAKDLSEAI